MLGRYAGNSFGTQTDLESLVLKNTLDGSVFTGWGELGLENDPEGAVADDFTLSVLHFLGFTRKTILDFLPNNFCHGVSANN